MKASELRIGNYVKDTHGDWDVMKVESILSSSNRVYLHTLDEEYLAEFLISDTAPIPLTEEWLLKFGFGSITIDNETFECAIKVDDNLLYTVRMFDSGAVIQVATPSLWQVAFAWEIKYVHQLQNLYFALTGEELTIKE